MWKEKIKTMITKKKGGVKSKRPSEAELEMLYSQMTAKEIAKRYEVCEETVRRWIAYYRRKAKNEEN